MSVIHKKREENNNKLGMIGCGANSESVVFASDIPQRSQLQHIKVITGVLD